MIDNELREMFAEREQFVPDPGPLARRITIGVERRRIRTRSLRVAAVAAVVVGAIVVAGVLGSAGLRHNTQPVGPMPGPTPSVSGVDGLVPASAFHASIPVRPGWLPPDLDPIRVFTDVNIEQSGSAITYERQPPGGAPGTENVAIQTYRMTPVVAGSTADGPPDWVTSYDQGVADVNGHVALQTRMSSRSVGTRSCTLIWDFRADLRVMVTVEEKTSDLTLSCDSGLRVARGIVDQPLELARSVQLTLVPAGYQLAETGTIGERWCRSIHSPADCVTAQLRRDNEPALGAPVTVHGHPGTLTLDPGNFTLIVPGWIQLEGTADLTNPQILRIAETAVLEGGW